MTNGHRKLTTTLLILCAMLLVWASVPAFADETAPGSAAVPGESTGQPAADAQGGEATPGETPSDPAEGPDSGEGTTGGDSDGNEPADPTEGEGATPSTGPESDAGPGNGVQQPATPAPPVGENTQPAPDHSSSTPAPPATEGPQSDGTVTAPSRRAAKRTGSSAKSPTVRNQAAPAAAPVMEVLRSTPPSQGVFGRSLNGANNAVNQIERNAESGAIAALVITRVIKQIPAWIFWALAALALVALTGLGLYGRERLRRRSAEQEAMVDQLTGISNRKAFDRRLDLEYRRASRYGRSLGLMIMDLDGFKQVNDSMGHAAGDRVLRQVAQSLQARMRDTDLVARIGGDEFAVICPETGINELMTIRRHLNELAVEDLKNEIGLSIGVAEYIPSDDDPLSLLSRADESMYRVKRGDVVALPA